MQKDEADSHDITISWQVYDASNSNKISEGEIPKFPIEYKKFPPDENKIMKYNWMKDYALSGAK